MKRTILTLALFFSFTMVLTSCKGEKKEEKTVETEVHESDAANDADIAMNYVYQCPMDCEDGKTYDAEGVCPKCEMDLKKVEKEVEGQDNDEAQAKDDNKGVAHDHDGDGKSDH